MWAWILTFFISNFPAAPGEEPAWDRREHKLRWVIDGSGSDRSDAGGRAGISVRDPNSFPVCPCRLERPMLKRSGRSCCPHRPGSQGCQCGPRKSSCTLRVVEGHPEFYGGMNTHGVKSSTCPWIRVCAGESGHPAETPGSVSSPLSWNERVSQRPHLAAVCSTFVQSGLTG